MPPESTSGELSLRHLPDVSNSSFSFQIPGAAQEYNLIAEDDLEFFTGADVSAGATSLSPPANITPFTLRDLTPRPTFEKSPYKDSKSIPFSSEGAPNKYNPKEEETRTTRLQYPEPSDVRTKVMSNLRPITLPLARPPPADAALSFGRMTTFKKDIDTLTADLHVPSSSNDQEPIAIDNRRPKGIKETSLEKKLPPLASRSERRQKLVPRNKQIVTEGGVTKSRATSNLSGRSPAQNSNSVDELRPVFPSHIKPTLSEDLNGDESVSDIDSMETGGGVAERLVQYGQNLTNSFGVYNSMPSSVTHEPSEFTSKSHVAPKITPSDVSLTISSIDNDGPLTLSQVSPRKRPALLPTPPTPPAKDPISPLRTSSKRPASPTSESLPRKKGKADPTPAGNTGAGPSSTLAIATTRQPIARKRHASSASASSSHSKPMGEEILKPQSRGTTIARKASTVRRSKPAHDDSKAMTKSSSASTSAASRSTRVLRNARPQDTDTKRPVSSLSSSRGKGKASISKISERPTFQIPPLPDATKPVPFQSLTESRLLVRKGGPSRGDAEASSQSQSQSSQRERKFHVPIPDFQAMHAAQEAKLALIKENIHPTVPQPLQLVTDLRVKERQKFDEMIKEREREQEWLDEERRREREAQEERELRELRKKAIPKAHSVPEWYKEAPKKKDSKFDSLGR